MSYLFRIRWIVFIAVIVLHTGGSSVFGEDDKERLKAIREYLAIKFDNFDEGKNGRRLYGPTFSEDALLDRVEIKELQPLFPETSFYSTNLIAVASGEYKTSLLVAVTGRPGDYTIRTCMWPIFFGVPPLSSANARFFGLFDLEQQLTSDQLQQLVKGVGELMAAMVDGQSGEVSFREREASVRVYDEFAISNDFRIDDVSDYWLRIKISLNAKNK